ncbi:hypothetical protein [Bythopirellula polymerisocia]|uniref:Outer membrane protein beta-barrel domain-containing protein n=1 Tax=Bythopirellula polymerisocia TaxID=2528003 RepID=A0A5C6CAJ1_9BACT|nr:hypothetical protein [Bythopirellula polymerisocia]TWU21238.1 hypothetical protein Pla144_46470 [Bythopirellula polymerisocia]
MLRLLPQLLLFLTAWLLGTSGAFAQRVQFPSQVPSYDVTPPGYTPPSLPPTTSPLTSSFDPYANPSLGTPPPDIPYTVSPQFAQPQQFGQPPLGQPIAPQLAPPVTPVVPQQGGSLYPNGLPNQWNSNTYAYGNSDGTVAQLQRLMQQISAEQTYLYTDGGVTGFGIDRTELAATFGVPIFYNPETPLLVTPGFAFNWWSGPSLDGFDLPPRVYDAYIDGAWHPQFNQFLSADLGLRTGVWTDFNNWNDAIRIMGRALGEVALTPKLSMLGGIWYLDRNAVKLLPAGGVHWRPNELWDMYLVFPNPKIRRRSITVGTSQWWIYLAGEYGGGRWAVERIEGDDTVDYNDIRVFTGIEWETQTQIRGHIEVGFAFDREIVYGQTATPNLDLDNTFMFRGGFDF